MRGAASPTVHILRIFGTKRIDNQASRAKALAPIEVVASGGNCCLRGGAAIGGGLAGAVFSLRRGMPILLSTIFSPRHLAERSNVETAAELAHPLGALF